MSTEVHEAAAPPPSWCTATGAHLRIDALDAPTSTLSDALRRLREADGRRVPRHRIRAVGRVAEIRVAAATEPASCEALLLVHDDARPEQPAEALNLVWQGQRSVPGLRTGTRLACSGLLCTAHGQPTVYNPRFEIVSRRGQR